MASNGLKLSMLITAGLCVGSVQADVFSSQANFSMNPGLAPSSGDHFQGNLTPVSYRAGPVFITPLLNLSIGHTDNVNNTYANKIGSMLTGIAPSLTFDMPKGPSNYELSYKGNYGIYSSASNANYFDHDITLQAANSWSVRSNSLVSIGYQKGHDAPNSTNLTTNQTERWHLTTVSGGYRYGAPGAKGEIDLGAAYGQKRYDTDLALTSGMDRNDTDFSASFLYRVRPATQLLFEVRHNIFDYVNGGLYSSRENHYLVGARWQITGITSGTVKIGEVTKKFENSSLPGSNFSGLGWEGVIDWSPLTYSRFKLDLSQNPSESTGYGSFILTRSGKLSWEHDWTEHTRTDLSFTDARDLYEGEPRVDKRKYVTAKVSYGLSRWLRVGVEYSHQSRDVSGIALASDYGYTTNMFLLTLEGAM